MKSPALVLRGGHCIIVCLCLSSGMPIFFRPTSLIPWRRHVVDQILFTDDQVSATRRWSFQTPPDCNITLAQPIMERSGFDLILLRCRRYIDHPCGEFGEYGVLVVVFEPGKARFMGCLVVVDDGLNHADKVCSLHPCVKHLRQVNLEMLQGRLMRSRPQFYHTKSLVQTHQPDSSYCYWWRRGRVELPVQKAPLMDVLQTYPALCSRFTKPPPTEFP